MNLVHTKIKIVLLCMMLILSLLFTSCDDSLTIVSQTINSYPNRIIYFSDIDSSIDLTGCTLEITIKSGETSIVDLSDVKFNVIHKIDFSMTGVYKVELKGFKLNESFTVQVVSRNEIEKMLYQIK